MSKTLQQKNTRSLLTWMPLVMLVASIFFYMLMTGHIHHLQTQQLNLKQDNILYAFRSTPGGIPLHIKGEYDIEKRIAGSHTRLNLPGDTALYYQDTKKWVSFTILVRQYSIEGTPYLVTTYISSKEITHLIIKVSIAEAVIFLLLVATIFIINRQSSRRLWTPFYDTMDAIKKYDIHQHRSLPLPPLTGTEEFDQLNQTLLALIDHVNKAYNNQKQFTENAAHELQTPLAIIRSKVELLIDSADLTEDRARLLADITDANERLSQMNKNLLLLTRIENHQFPRQQTISISETILKLAAYYQDHYDQEMPVIKTSIEPEIQLVANPALIEILLANLLRNAIIHNIPNGWVHISLDSSALIIENSGPALTGDTDQLFERFKKGREESRTTGLGLALVRQIAQLYKFGLEYHYHEGTHRLRLAFTGI